MEKELDLLDRYHNLLDLLHWEVKNAPHLIQLEVHETSLPNYHPDGSDAPDTQWWVVTKCVFALSDNLFFDLMNYYHNDELVQLLKDVRLLKHKN